MGLVLLLSAFGILMIASAVSGNQILASYPWRQAGFLASGLALLFFVAAVDYRLLSSITYPVYGILLLALVAIAVAGTVAGGAQRWLTLGELFIQPSELAKIGVILALAQYLSAREERMGRLTVFLGALILLVPALVLIYMQPNLGTTLVLVVIGAAMLFVAGLRWHHMALISAAAAAAVVPAWQYLLHGYMKDRILMLLDPSQVSAADRYNVDQATISIGSGGWLGRGLFRGTQNQLHFLRVRHTDFIFSILGEELGLIGEIVVIAAFCLLLYAGTRVAARAPDTFGRLLAAGIVSWFGLQALVNLGAATRRSVPRGCVRPAWAQTNGV